MKFDRNSFAHLYMHEQIAVNEVKFDYIYDAETVWLFANYRDLLFAKLSFRRPGAGYDVKMLFEFVKTEQFEYIKSKLIQIMQMDSDKL